MHPKIIFFFFFWSVKHIYILINQVFTSKKRKKKFYIYLCYNLLIIVAKSLGCMCVWQILSFKTEKLKSCFEWYIKRFQSGIFLEKILCCFFFSCLLKWIVIISFKFHFIFCVILYVGIFFCSCLNQFLPFYILFNVDVFLIIINFPVLFSVFIVFKPKMFCIGLFSELGFSFFYYWFKCVPYFFSIPTVVENVNICFIVFTTSITHWWYIIFVFSIIMFFY